ncbi:MAG: hypothetical protein ACOC5I_01725 [Gemmatimonadota bacterium]
MRTRLTLLVLILTVPLVGCEDGPPWRGAPPQTDESVAPEFGPVAAYNRRFLFLGAGTELSTAAVFDFTVLSDTTGTRRGARIRIADPGWRTLLDEGWVMGPMREPWRLVPHGPLKMVVTETGDLDALVHRDSLPTRLHLDATLAEHGPDVGTRLVLRRARLVLPDRTFQGVVLDAQLGRSVAPRFTSRVGAFPGTGTDTTTALPPTPIARPGAEALLVADGSYHAVLTTASGGDLAWVRHAGADDVRAGVRIEPGAWTEGPDSIPSVWQVTSADGQLTGELTHRSSDRADLAGVEDAGTLVYALVSGWIEDRSARRDVVGILRHVW